MDNIIEISNLTFEYSDKIIFKCLNMNIKKGDFVTVSGISGKTTLVKILSGLLSFKGDIKINKIHLVKKTINDIREIISVVNEKNNNFINNTVYEEIYNILEDNGLNNNQINKRIDEIVDLLDIKDLLEYNPKYLSCGEKQLISLSLALSTNPEILILDDAFSMMDEVLKEKMFKILKKLNKDKKMTILNFTKDLEESLYSKRVILIDEKVILNEPLKNAYKEEKKYLQLGLELPFMVNLSNKLKYYNLLDDIILDMDKMVNHLWK